MQYTYEEIQAVDINSDYKAKGFSSRSAYLTSLANDYGISSAIVFSIANALGRNEDFDGLLTEIENYLDGEDY